MILSYSQDYGWEIKVLGLEECTALKMGAYLAVSQGSKDGPEFIHLTYKPKSGTVIEVSFRTFSLNSQHPLLMFLLVLFHRNCFQETSLDRQGSYL